MNYFEIFDLPLSMAIDHAELKRKYLKKSRAFHPDFFGQASEEEKLHAQKQTALFNEAYETLNSEERRLKHILQIWQLLTSEKQPEMSPAFLMEMMDINEQLMEAKMTEDHENIQQVTEALASKESSFRSAVDPLLLNPNLSQISEEDKAKLLDYYLKKRYLRRLSLQLHDEEEI